MKYCPKCHHTYTDETLKFCREDGTLLQANASAPGESSATLLLPAIRTSDAPPTQFLQSDTAQAKEVTSPIEATRNSQTSGSPDIHPTSNAEYIISEIKQHKRGVAVALTALLVATIGFGSWFFSNRPSSSTGPAPMDSIAVLPFQNKNIEPDTEYLSDGLAESLIYRLSQLPNLKVSPTSSVFRYKGKETDPVKVGQELGVSAVLLGRITRRGDNLTISVELVDVRINKLLWGEQYDRKLSDLLATQREIAGEIVERLKVKVSGADLRGVTKDYTDSNEAYQLYLKGRYHWNKRTKEDIQRGIQYYQQAINQDPNFALAFAGIADSYTVMPTYPYLSPKEAYPRAKAASQRALEIDPTLAEAHVALATVLAYHDWNWAGAEREFKRALELDPDYADAHYRYGLVYLMPLGRTDEAIAEVKRALALEPLSLIINANLGGAYIYARQFDRALEQTRKTQDLEPSFVAGQYWLCEAYAANGMYNEAIALSQKMVQADPTSQRFFYLLGYAYAKAGRKPEAEVVINKLKDISRGEYVISSLIARIYAALDKRDEAFALLEKAFEEREYSLPRLKVDPAFDSLRNDPRFQDLLQRIGLTS